LAPLFFFFFFKSRSTFFSFCAVVYALGYPFFLPFFFSQPHFSDREFSFDGFLDFDRIWYRFSFQEFLPLQFLAQALFPPSDWLIFLIFCSPPTLTPSLSFSPPRCLFVLFFPSFDFVPVFSFFPHQKILPPFARPGWS